MPILLFAAAVAGGVDWDTIVRLTSDPASQVTGRFGQRAVTVDRSGNVWVVWLDQRTVPYQLWVRRFDAMSRSWLPEEQLTGVQANCFPAAAAADEQGDVHVVWHMESWPCRGIWYKRYDARRRVWEPETLFHPLSSNRSGVYPSVAALPRGGVAVVWIGHTDTSAHRHVLLRELLPDSGWTRVFQVTTVACDHDQSAVAADSLGNLYVVWQGADHGGEYRHIHCRRRVRGEWQEIEYVSDMSGAPDQYAPNVTTALDGDKVHVVWHGRFHLELYQRVLYRQRSAGQWLPVEGPSGVANYQREQPDVVYLGGCVAAVWRGQVAIPSGTYQLFYAERDSSGYWQAPAQLTEIDSGYVTEPTIVLRGRDLHVVWYDNSSGNLDVYYLHGTRPGTGISGTMPDMGRRTGRRGLWTVTGQLVSGGPKRAGVYFLLEAGAVRGRKVVVWR